MPLTHQISNCSHNLLIFKFKPYSYIFLVHLHFRVIFFAKKRTAWFATNTNAPNNATAYTAGDLGTLADNGGATPTIQLSASAPAYQTGTFAYYNATDSYYFKGSDNLYYKLTLGSAAFTPSSANPENDKITTDQRGATRDATPSMGAYDGVAADPSWDGSAWSPASPTATDNAVISSNYSSAGFSCKNLTINAGKQFSLTSGTLTVSGNLSPKSDATGTATLLDGGNTVSVTGTTNVEQYLTSDRKWYVSSPVSAATK